MADKCKPDPILSRLRKLCLALPGTTETLTWGHPNFRVEGKIFIGYGEQAGQRCIGGKVGKPRQRELLRNPRYLYSHYVGRFGWVSLVVEGGADWNEVAGLVLASYRLIAPKRLVTQLDDEPSPQAKTCRPKSKRKK